MHPVEQLWAELAAFQYVPHPRQAEPLGPSDRVDGIAFFPVGTGLWNTKNGIPPGPNQRPLMLLGNNFSNRGYLDRVLRNRGEVHLDEEPVAKDPTWRALIALLGEVPIPPEACFFTNAYMVLMAGVSSRGDLKLSDSDPLERQCQRFFERQVKLMSPRVIVCLGQSACAFVARHCIGQLPWPDRPTAGFFRSIDSRHAAVIDLVRVGSTTVTVVALTHPSYRHINAQQRPEIEFLRDAIRDVRLS